jgi:hypothetical protein
MKLHEMSTQLKGHVAPGNNRDPIVGKYDVSVVPTGITSMPNVVISELVDKLKETDRQTDSNTAWRSHKRYFLVSGRTKAKENECSYFYGLFQSGSFITPSVR